ncbi:MAG: hypothetical protein E4H03_10340 [Myxococcales bacterium]|nr:MAG: hypothetical protein E4H03_10340 [Myxococcales bacterium]
MRQIRPYTIIYTLAALAGAAFVAPGTIHAQVDVPVFTSAELKCQTVINTASTQYVKDVFVARQSCFDAQMAGTIALDVDCRVDVNDNSSTGDEGTDDALRKATGRLLADVPPKCAGIDLSILGFPGFCRNVPVDRPFDTFDLTDCLLTSSEEVVALLIDFEQPSVDFVFVRPERVCRNDVSVKSSRLFTGEFEARQNCLIRQLKQKISEDVDCRLEENIDAPGTGDPGTDDLIVAAHGSKLRAISNACGHIFLDDVGFPNMCPAPGGNVYPLTALRECMFSSHHFDMIRFLDIMNPLTTKCGNGDLDFTEQCDDGDNTTEPGKLCRFDCSINANCGDPLDTGTISTSDALFILHAAIGLESCDLSLCDLNGDGFITVVDAQVALLIAAGLDATLNCPAPLSLTCGNGTLDRFEQCDDGDILWTLGESCNSSCLRLGCGDPNDSGAISVVDAVIILDVANEERECDLTVCDVDNNGRITVTDAMIVLQVAGELDVTLNCPAF